MDSITPLTPSPGSVRNWTDDTPRVKILCSFNGSILPRPQDGKLRYVGGESRILSVPRDIGFEELMARMKELFDGASVLKYKQPDEDLDALVSVVNDDDVTNMMEEFDKLGPGDGFARLRVFLFSNSELDDPLHFLDADGAGREHERRYVDALNSLNDFQMGHVDDVQLTEQYFNLHHLTIPQLDSSHSPVYYSPRHPGSEFASPSPPSCSCYHGPYGESADRIYVSHLSPVDHQPQLPETVPWFHEKAGFPSNMLHGTNMFDGNNVCDHCPPPFPHPFYLKDSSIAMGPAAYPDSHHMPLPYAHQDDRSPYIRHRHEFGNYPYAYGHIPANSNSLWRDIQSPSSRNGSPSNETSISPQQESGLFRSPLVESPPKLAGYNAVDIPDCYPVRPLKLIPNSYNVEDHNMSFDPVQSTANLINCSNPNDSVIGFDRSPTLVDHKAHVTESLVKIEGSALNAEVIVENAKIANFNRENALHSPEKGEIEAERLSYMPEIVESVKKISLESGEEERGEAKEIVDSATEKAAEVTEETIHELDVVDAPEDLELDSDTGTESNSKIEQTKAEEEAIARGLQTIKNDDLEEIRQLGSGTYGAVYHGKWKGSDVAIKRIKASCFSGKPTERERMIADFWKEALMLSSLHHPNVVSFYGIVRDGPDGSLATVTEYMINGSLKQFLKKKDRTIDRRKRLIIAMDTAFGMEYLHGKNVVHFDLKCENLLVNMRDPHRPICKIGDLGLSKVKQHTMVSGGVRGTLPWMAPELLSGKSHMVTEKIDVYSFGVVMWELLTGDEPYTNMDCANVIGGIVNNTLRPTIPTWCDPQWKSLMESCWSADPQQRPSFLEISQKLRIMAAAINVK
ncbi:hypothetical protein L1987_21130 [Smallanthus sonchifolius]|uniref:Uncharacterized protein n=1 Tax=Smallanthus sonchifolius TaxID=185202 RepID=A0ACB9IUR4_9ASTR|nr:hypothetical protein L1987_21130 [Smallanthus sonchifolius]